MRQKRSRKPNDIEARAADARTKRELACGKAMQKILEEHKCTMFVTLTIGQQVVDASAVLSVPIGIAVRSR